MVKLLFDLLEFLRSCAPLLVSLAVLTLLCILLSKSIRKHATIYYVVLGIPFALIVLPTIAKLFGVEMAGFARVPFLGEIIRDYIHMGTFGHPLLIIIMYMGALDMKTPGVKKLMSIRKELSIISGFAVLSHSLIRVINNLPPALRFFADNDGYLAETKVANVTGAGITNFSFVWGILLLVIFIPLWVTSFDSIRNRMGYKKWKNLQKWAYVLYAALFIHAVGIQVGFMLNPRGGHAEQKPAVEKVVAQAAESSKSEVTEKPAANAERHGHGGEGRGRANAEQNKQNPQASAQTSNRRAPAIGFKDINVSSLSLIHI